MPMHRIEVDDEVMTYLKGKAEPFVDSPNSVLRRELLGHRAGRSATPEIPTNGLLPEIPPGTPTALQHILEVVHLVRSSSRSRTEATHVVARKHGVAFQTVLDKYCRQLGLTADQFDGLLRDTQLAKLRALVKNRFRNHEQVVDDILE